jgi:hypothetical protein
VSPAPISRHSSGLVAALLASVVLILVSAGPSSAAPYTVWSCQGPNGEALPGSAWTGAASGAGAAASTDCATGMRAGLPAGRAATRSAATLTFTAPPATRVTSFELVRSLKASIGGLFSTGYVANVTSLDPAGPLGAGCAGGGFSLPSSCAVGDDPPLTAAGISTGGIQLAAGCTQDSCPSATPTAEATLSRSRVVLDDQQAPTVSGTTGTLKDTDRVARSLTVAAADAGGGVALITANVDGGAFASSASGGTCAEPYVIAQPCPGSRESTFSIDTGALKPGDHVATGTITDAAGSATAWGPVPFTVPSGGSKDPGPAPAGSIPVPVSPATTPDGAPAPTARLTLQGTRDKRGRRVPTGFLRTLGGTPLAGMTVRLTRTQTGAAMPRTVALKAVRTDKNGRFTAAALPEGAWTVAGASDVSSGTVTGSVRLRTGLRLTATPSPKRLRTGARMVLSGRLTGAGPAKAGLRVRIQAIIRGDYETVATVRTSARGTFRWRHRFTKVSRPTLFAFRVLVPGEGAVWPWKPVSRRAATVRVDPR